MTTITAINVATTANVKTETPKEEKATITLQEWWSGEKSLTSTAARRVGWENLADWLEDKDKICTDGQDDGKLGFKEGTKAFAKGLFGGIPKAMINHPLITGGVIALAAGATVLTGGAAAPILWGLGAAGVAISGSASIVKAAAADTDAEKKAALEGAGTSTAAAALLGATYNTTMTAAKQAGVNTDGNIAQTMKSSAEVSAKNIKGNVTYLKDGVVTGEATLARRGMQTSFQGDGKPLDAYRINIDKTLTVEQNLANNPGLSYEATTGQYYVQTSWGAKSYVNPDAAKGYMFVKYGPGDNNAVEGVEFLETYVDYGKFANGGTKSYVDPTTLEAGKAASVTKQAPGHFKVMPEGTKYIGGEGPATLQPKSVMRFDNQGRPYQSTVEFMFKKFQNLTPEQISMLKSVDPEAAAKYGY